MKLALKHTKQSGFTLLEVLLVVAIIAILAGIVIIAINPSKQLGDTRNSQRQSNVTTISNAVYQYYLDNNTLPSTIPSSSTQICATTGANCSSLIDLGVLTTNEKYLVSLPSDPQCPTGCGTYGTGYFISKDANNRVTVTAPSAENGKTISATR